MPIIAVILENSIMKPDKLSYTRTISRKVKRVATSRFLELTSFTTSNRPIFELNDLPKNYSREVKTKRGTRLYIIISGAEKKEYKYFSNLGHIVPVGMAVPLVFACPIGFKSGANTMSHYGSAPNDIVSYWEERFDEETSVLCIDDRVYELSNEDRVFFVSDVDEYHKQLSQHLSKSNNRCYKWIVSNPCFETWLYYSYVGNPAKEHIETLQNESISQRSKLLKKIGNDVHKGGLDPRIAPKYIHKAIERCDEYGYKVDENNVPLLFCTDMLFFAKDFIEYISKFK